MRCYLEGDQDWRIRLALTLGLCLSLVACQSPSGGSKPAPSTLPDASTSQSKDAQQTADELVPWDEPISVRGNPLKYSVFGVEYRILPTARGYVETGIASWYGPGFHNKLTSNGEVYDMHAITAAHKTLPLPTYARVKNLQNGKEVIVRINDRGPFAKNRIIDLSYAVAVKLDMIQQGTALVEVEAITPPFSTTVAEKEPEVISAITSKTAQPCDIRVSIQVGAFAAQANAQNLKEKLILAGFSEATVLWLDDDTPAPNKVRLPGPEEVSGLDQLLERLAQSGFAPVHMIVERESCDR